METAKIIRSLLDPAHEINPAHSTFELKTKTGKTRLGPLGLHQLEELLSKSSRPKDKAKIKNHIRIVKSRK